MAQRELTDRQKEILAYVEERQRSAGFPPTLQEIAAHFGFKSANSVRQHLRLIENKGRVRRLPGRSRALVVPKVRRRSPTGFVRIPLLGSIAAGNPILAAPSAESVLDFPEHLFRGAELFALRVKGGSMEGAGILGGDIAVLDAAAEVGSGAIGAVLIGDEATLKYIHREDGGLLLRAANAAFPDLKLDSARSEQARVMGRLVGVVRSI